MSKFISPNTPENDHLLATFTYVARSVICQQPAKWQFWKREERGLFAKVEIPKGTLIGHYTGSSISWKDFLTSPEMGDVEHTYILWTRNLDPAYPYLDGSNMANKIGIVGESLLRYANHAKNPNMYVEELSSAFTAARDIAAGEELSWYYGPSMQAFERTSDAAPEDAPVLSK